MRQSFEGFLAQYCQKLTDIKTRSLKRLFVKVLQDSPRAAEPLMLLALCQGREEYLMHLAKQTKMREEYQSFLAEFKKSGLALEEYLTLQEIPQRYQKVYFSYLSKVNQLERDREVLEALVPQLNSMIASKGLTPYSILNILSLNKGNLYAFLKGDVSKLSRATAMKLYDYVASAR